MDLVAEAPWSEAERAVALLFVELLQAQPGRQAAQVGTYFAKRLPAPPQLRPPRNCGTTGTPVPPEPEYHRNPGTTQPSTRHRTLVRSIWNRQPYSLKFRMEL